MNNPKPVATSEARDVWLDQGHLRRGGGSGSTYVEATPCRAGRRVRMGTRTQPIARLKSRVLELSIIVSTHPFWTSVEGGLGDADMPLKHAY